MKLDLQQSCFSSRKRVQVGQMKYTIVKLVSSPERNIFTPKSSKFRYRPAIHSPAHCIFINMSQRIKTWILKFFALKNNRIFLLIDINLRVAKVKEGNRDSREENNGCHCATWWKMQSDVCVLKVVFSSYEIREYCDETTYSTSSSSLHP